VDHVAAFDQLAVVGPDAAVIHGEVAAVSRRPVAARQADLQGGQALFVALHGRLLGRSLRLIPLGPNPSAAVVGQVWLAEGRAGRQPVSLARICALSWLARPGLTPSRRARS